MDMTHKCMGVGTMAKEGKQKKRTNEEREEGKSFFEEPTGV
jgi:hypothetical protein